MTRDIPHPSCSGLWEMICFKDHLILCGLSLLILKTMPLNWISLGLGAWLKFGSLPSSRLFL